MGFISVLIVIISILLILVVLIQNSKGGGIASNFAGTNQVVGVKRQNELVERVTWILAGGLLVLCLLSSSFTGQAGPVEKESVVKNAAAPTPNTPTPVIPGGQQNGPMTQPVTPPTGQ